MGKGLGNPLKIHNYVQSNRRKNSLLTCDFNLIGKKKKGRGLNKREKNRKKET